jgi:hypothetical protein
VSPPVAANAGRIFDRRTGNKSFYGLGVKDFLIGRQRLKSWCAMLFAALTIAPGCSNLALPNENMPASGVNPAYSKLVATFIKNVFQGVSPSDAAEISEPRWVQSDKGWSWLACVHFQDHGRRRTYSVFFKQNDVVDARYSVLTDGCGTQTYLPLDMTTGGLRPGAIGDTGPLY